MAVTRPDPRQFLLPEALAPGDVLTAFGRRFLVALDPVAVADRTFLDTFDGRLHAAGRVLESSRGDGRCRLTLLDGERAVSAEVESSPAVVRLADVPAGPLRDALARTIDVRALLPQARVRSRVASARLCNDDDKTVVRLAIEEPVVVRRGETAAPLASVVTVRPVLGYEKDFERACSILEVDLGLPAPAAPLVDLAITAAGGRPAGVSAKVGVKLRPEMRSDEATVLLCRRLADIVEANLPGTIDDIDAEFLHDLRVAVRRTRSVLKEMKGVLPPDDLERAKADLRWIQEVTGLTRDYDVQLEEWPGLVGGLPHEGVTDLQPLHDLLVEHRAQAFRAMRRQLRSARYSDAWAAWRAVLQGEFVGRDDVDRPNAGRPIAELAGGRVRLVYSHMVDLGGSIDDDSSPELLHDLRKRGKELRYLLELFGQLWDPEVVNPMVSALKTLQDVLGTFQDDSVQAGHLRAIAPTIDADTGRTDLLLALGVVLNQLARNQDTARRHFSERFESFSAPRIRKQVRRTFKPLKQPKQTAAPAE